MAERINHKTDMDKAIVDKVASVLSNAKCIQSVHIEIDGEVGSAPLIEYRITEAIVPKSEVEE